MSEKNRHGSPYLAGRFEGASIGASRQRRKKSGKQRPPDCVD